MRNTKTATGLLLAFLIILSLSINAGAAIDDIKLFDITPPNLFSHSTISLAFTDNELITLGAGNRLLNVYNIKDIVNPRRHSILELPAEGRRICTGPGAAYIVCPGYGLLVIDLGNPLVPKLSEKYEMSLSPDAVAFVHEGYLFLHDGKTTLRSYELTRPWELREVDSIEVTGGIDLAYMDGILYTAGSGIEAIDISNPRDLAHAGGYAGLNASIWGVAAKDGIVCAIDDTDRLAVLRASGGNGTLEEISEFDVGQVMRDVAIFGNLAVVATADNFISIDITKPQSPVFHGSLPLVCELREIRTFGNYFFIATELDGPLIIDVSDPFHQRVVAYQAGLGLVSTIASRGSLLLTGSWDSIRALERKDEGKVEIVGIQHSEGYTKEMQIIGDFAYLADPSRGLRVFNVSKPVFMRPVALLELPGTPSDVELVGELAFIPLGEEGVAQVNVHYPFKPVLRMMIETDLPVDNVTKKGDYIYFIGPSGWMGIYDISLPTQPRQAAWLQLEGITPQDAVVHGDLMAIAGGDSGMWLFNVADPIRPMLRSKYIPGGSVETVALFDDGAVLEVKGPGYCKIEAVDLRYIFAPHKRDEIQIAERSQYRDKLHVEGDKAYLAAYNYGMKIFDIRGLLD